MIWLGSIGILACLAVILLRIEPQWVQYLAFAVSISLFSLILIKEIKLPGNFKNWIKTKTLLLTLIPFFLITNLIIRKYEPVWDVSEYKNYSFRQESIDWISKVNEPVEIMIFLKTDDKTSTYALWLQDQLDKHTSFVNVKTLNINRDVSLANRYGITSPNQAVLISGINWVKVDSFKEDAIISGMIKLLSKQDVTICFLSGDGEPDVDDDSPSGLSVVKSTLTDMGYKTSIVALKDKTNIMSSCSLLIIINPKTSLLPSEAKNFNELLNSETPILFAAGQLVSPEMKTLLKSAGITLSEEIVIEPNNVEDKTSVTDIVLERFENHPVNDNLSGRLYMPDVQQILTGTSNKFQLSKLLTTPFSKEYALLDEQNRSKEDTSQSFILAVTTQTAEKEPAMVIFGSAGAFLNKNLNFGVNKGIFINAIRWLIKENQVSLIAPREYSERLIRLDESESEWIKRLLVYALPGFLLIVCGLIFIGHRKTR
ncbi:MAG: Gldg family protein [Pseudomonadota bacterium]